MSYSHTAPRAIRTTRTSRLGLHPLHAFFLAATSAAFFGALLSVMAYSSSYEVQWTNFASWLITGGLISGGAALVCAIAGLFRSRNDRLYLVYAMLVLVTWIFGLLNALVHARDAWASMPTGLILSIIVAITAAMATWLGFSTTRSGELS